MKKTLLLAAVMALGVNAGVYAAKSVQRCTGRALGL